MKERKNIRPLEDGIKLDVSERKNYGGYLCLDTLFSAQKPLSDPEHHDEMLFIIQHQTSELWMKLIVHELTEAIRCVQIKRLGRASKILARVKQIQKQLFEQWAVLETLTPSEYTQFRHVLGNASGFQSVHYRQVEFLLGNKNKNMVKVFPEDSESRAILQDVLAAPSIYDVFIKHLFDEGYSVPESLVQRDLRKPHVFNQDLMDVLVVIYKRPDQHWAMYALCEQLVDVEQSFQLWRFRHMKTVERIIGFKQGTGGSSGVSFLKKALELTFFPELLKLRTEL
ncbi:tryptophan 2,3-dioxygenase family protein [Marinicella sp. S1101]|uniref:tryptophan 2,3-dioxygenase n=1 Tax=Marinicella marina TaxID=2996016 RepID=UPI0022610072|nr:tryptophan 2,3-dioxygenase family protein [Marinicella marina]MCX7555162.1 tryptophan 2,3-dioxygenase family protein [Marinicella marina]MDJ1141397.1 tryptophan 2,3-dioxygenase family protein [Marinicella marina]